MPGIGESGDRTTRNQIGAAKIKCKAKAMENHGSGIVLWEDIKSWKLAKTKDTGGTLEYRPEVFHMKVWSTLFAEIILRPGLFACEANTKAVLPYFTEIALYHEPIVVIYELVVSTKDVHVYLIREDMI